MGIEDLVKKIATLEKSNLELHEAIENVQARVSELEEFIREFKDVLSQH